MNDNDIGIDATGTDDEGLRARGAAHLISDREVDALAEAELAWERWERTRRWWAQGCLDEAAAIRDAG